MKQTALTAIPVLLLLPACASTPAVKAEPPPPDALDVGTVQEVTTESIVAPVGDAVQAEPADTLPRELDEWREARFGFTVPSYDTPASELSWAQISDELIAMRSPELAKYRRAAPAEDRDQALHAYIQRIDRAHVARLKEICEAHAWPTFEHVGARAASAAVLTVQYAGHDPDFLEHAIEQMTPLAKTGQVSPPYVALLTDRLRVYRNQDQVFGTQVRVTVDADGRPIVSPTTPIEAPEQLDERRAAFGLPPHQDFIDQISSRFAAQSAPEPDVRLTDETPARIAEATAEASTDRTHGTEADSNASADAGTEAPDEAKMSADALSGDTILDVADPESETETTVQASADDDSE